MIPPHTSDPNEQLTKRQSNLGDIRTTYLGVVVMVWGWGVFQVAYEALGGRTHGGGSGGAEGELCGEQKTLPSLGGHGSSGVTVVVVYRRME